MEILTSDYERRWEAYELCGWLNSCFREAREANHFNDFYFERRGRNVKRLIEEAIPLSRLALHFCKPWTEVYVTLQPEHERYDAVFEVEGMRFLQFKVEVTTTETQDTTARRHGLARNGFVHFTGTVRKEGRKVISEGEMVNVSEEEQRLVSLAFDRVKAKIESGRYGQDTAILGYITQHREPSLDARAGLVRQTQNYILSLERRPINVFYCYAAGFAIDPALESM